jgi:hypothetical protein
MGLIIYFGFDNSLVGVSKHCVEQMQLKTNVEIEKIIERHWKDARLAGAFGTGPSSARYAQEWRAVLNYREQYGDNPVETGHGTGSWRGDD